MRTSIKGTHRLPAERLLAVQKKSTIRAVAMPKANIIIIIRLAYISIPDMAARAACTKLPRMRVKIEDDVEYAH